MCIPRSSSPWREKHKASHTVTKGCTWSERSALITVWHWTQLHATEDWEGCRWCQAVYGCTPDLLRLKEEEKGMPGTQRRRWGPHIGGSLHTEALWLREAEFGYDISQETRIGPSKVQMLPQLCPQKHGVCLSLERDKLFRNTKSSCRRTSGSPKVRKNIH